MLVLSRSKNEVIVIGDAIHITVVDIKGDTVKLGIQAPRDIPVHRKEVWEAIQAENVEAGQAGLEDITALESLFRKKKDPEADPGKDAGDRK